MRFLSRLCALCLAFSLLSLPALAAQEISLRQEDLDFLYATLQEIHPGFEALTEGSAFSLRKAEIEAHLSTVSQEEFALDLQSLIALLGDSHTTSNLSSVLSSSPLYPFVLDRYEGTWILQAAPAQYSSRKSSCPRPC